MNRNEENASKYDYVYQAVNYQLPINGRSQTNRN